MPLLLYRYILGDLLRVVLLTTTVLALVIAFGAAVRPLAEDELLSSAQVAKYIGLTLVPMLQYALPFAAGFAATMAFHRMACDNEFVAIAVGGISYPRILMPVLALGVVLTVLMVGLTQWVIPQFWGLLAETVSRDVTDLFIAKVRSRQPFTVGDTQIHADRIVLENRPPETGADTRLVLKGVAAAELDRDRRVTRDVTASDAVIDIYRRSGETILKLVLLNTVVFESETGRLVHMRQVNPDAVVIPSPLRTELRAMTRGRLKSLYDHPDGYSTVVNFKRELAHEIYDHVVWDLVRRQLEQEGRVTLTDRTPGGPSFVVEASSIEHGAFGAPNKSPIVVTQFAAGQPALRFECERVELLSALSDTGDVRWFELNLGPMEVTMLDGSGTRNFRARRVVSNLDLAAAPVRDLAGQPAESVLAAARTMNAESEVLGRLAERLERRIERLRWEVSSRLSQRYALSMTAVLLVVLGSILAMWLRTGQPLTIYLCAFLPSILDLILISGGEQVMREGVIIGGGAIMWSGNVIMLIVIGLAFARLRRH